MQRQSPSPADYVKEFGPEGLKVEENGRWTYDIPRGEGRRFLEMNAGYRSAERRREAATAASFPSVSALDRFGRPVEVAMTYEGREDVLGRKGKIKPKRMRLKSRRFNTTPMTRQETVAKGCSVLGHERDENGRCHWCGEGG